MDQLLCDIDSDQKLAPINTLCKFTENTISFLSPQSALPLHDIDIKFDIMLSSESTLFLEIWNEHTNSAAEKTGRAQLTIDEIRTVLWDGTFEACYRLLQTLRDRSIKLSEVDHYFKHNGDEFPEQLRKLNVGLHQCINKQSDCSWIDDSVHHIRDYWSLLTLSEEAKAIMSLKKRLSLTNDFTAINSLTDQVTYMIDCLKVSIIASIIFL